MMSYAVGAAIVDAALVMFDPRIGIIEVNLRGLIKVIMRSCWVLSS